MTKKNQQAELLKDGKNSKLMFGKLGQRQGISLFEELEGGMKVPLAKADNVEAAKRLRLWVEGKL